MTEISGLGKDRKIRNLDKLNPGYRNRLDRLFETRDSHAKDSRIMILSLSNLLTNASQDAVDYDPDSV